MSKILLVEDELRMAENLKQVFTKELGTFPKVPVLNLKGGN